MVGKIIGDKVILEGKEASKNYNKGCFGILNGKLTLHLVEACYLLEKERIEVGKGRKKISLHELMQYAVDNIPEFEIKYLVYRDLRERGYVVRMGNDFLLYERGKRPPAEPAFLVKAVSERATFSIKDVSSWIDEAGEKALLIGIVDEEGDITYYLTKIFSMSGKVNESEYEGEITILHDRSIVFDENLMEELRKGFIGRDFGKYVELSLMETAYLAEKGAKILKNREEMDKKEFLTHVIEIQPDIKGRLKVYKDLRKKGLLPKTGFKFGSHFRVYTHAPHNTHAPYLVHVVRSSYKATWAEISRAIRLAHSVKKEMVFAMVGKKIKYIRLKRITP
ncbi:MAG: tRNA-intron lyase [Thermoplasmata archaeon]|nr:MAG: tRNA-intron lyase [Thermoplasmata archaeon]